MTEENLKALLKDFREKQRKLKDFDDKHPWVMAAGKGPTYLKPSEMDELGKLIDEMYNAWKKYREARGDEGL